MTKIKNISREEIIKEVLKRRKKRKIQLDDKFRKCKIEIPMIYDEYICHKNEGNKNGK